MYSQFTGVYPQVTLSHGYIGNALYHACGFLPLTRCSRTRRASRALSGCCRISVRACPTSEEGLFSFISLPISMKPAGFRVRDSQSPFVMDNVQNRSNNLCPLRPMFHCTQQSDTLFPEQLPAQSHRLNFQKALRCFLHVHLY